MPSVELFETREIAGKPWGTELVIAETADYLGKVLFMNAGHRGGLQYHNRKDETFYLYSGRARVTFDPGNGLVTRKMKPGMSYHVPPGAVHQVEAITDCVFFEASTPVFNDRVNVGAQYGRPDTSESR